MQELKIFEEKQIRTVWDEVQEKWYFCIIDIVQILTESKDYHTARKYWNKLKQRLVSEGNETVTNCHQLKLMAADGNYVILMWLIWNRCYVWCSQSLPKKQSQ